jgi:hypothetical protein
MGGVAVTVGWVAAGQPGTDGAVQNPVTRPQRYRHLPGRGYLFIAPRNKAMSGPMHPTQCQTLGQQHLGRLRPPSIGMYAWLVKWLAQCLGLLSSLNQSLGSGPFGS